MKNESPHLIKPLSEVNLANHRFGVVLPIAEPSPRLEECLNALVAALARAVEKGHEADLYVVLDGRNAACARIASTFPVRVVTADFADLASARAIGARVALAAGVTWLAFTESSALVAESWLIEQISADAELLIGGVEVTNGFMGDASHDERSVWRDAQPLQHLSPHFSNLGMSRAAFQIASNLGGQELRLDAALLDQLTTLELATHRCSKPLVYSRLQAFEDALAGKDLFVEAVRSAPSGIDTSLMSAMPEAAAMSMSMSLNVT